MQVHSMRLMLAIGMAVPVALTLGSVGVAGADTISTGSLTSQTSGSGINDDGSLISVGSGYYAANFDSTSGGTVGSVTFTPFLTGTGSTASKGTGAGGNLTLTNFGHLYNQYFNHNGTTFTTGDTSLDTILTGGVYEDGTSSGTPNPPGQITFNNLTAGQSYQVQFFAVDNRQSSNLSGRTFQISNNSTFSNAGSGAYASPVVQYAFDSTGTVASVGSYIDWTFTASGVTQTFYEQLGNNSSTSSQFNTFQGAQLNGVIITPAVAPVPEPAALPLFGLAGTAGLLLLRRRGAAVHRPSV